MTRSKYAFSTPPLKVIIGILYSELESTPILPSFDEKLLPPARSRFQTFQKMKVGTH
jgi:hypothetical protein